MCRSNLFGLGGGSSLLGLLLLDLLPFPPFLLAELGSGLLLLLWKWARTLVTNKDEAWCRRVGRRAATGGGGRGICAATYLSLAEVVDNTGSSDDDGNTSNGVDDSLVLGDPVGDAIPEGGVGRDSDGRGGRNGDRGRRDGGSHGYMYCCARKPLVNSVNNRGVY